MRGERIGTGGKPDVALLFDHHLEEFESKVLPPCKSNDSRGLDGQRWNPNPLHSLSQQP